MSSITRTGVFPRVETPTDGNAGAVSVQIAAFRRLLLLMLAFFALFLILLALPWVAGASADAFTSGEIAVAFDHVGDEATWANAPPAIIAASEDGEGGQTWSETPPSIITAGTGDGGSGWFNSAPEIVLSSTAQSDPVWSQAVPPQAAAR